MNNREVALPFTPANNAPVITTGTGDISLYFDSTGVSFTRKGTILDGIGPLLKDTAYVVERFDNIADTFFVKFTEKVEVNDISDESFILLKDGREITVEVIGTAEDITGEIEISFAADLGGEKAEVGDSLKILYTGPVVDKRDNSAHRDNVPVPIAVLKRPVPVTDAAYYDTDGDGIVDQVRIWFKKGVDNPDKLKATFTWQSDNITGTVDGLDYYSGSDKKILKAEVRDIFGLILYDRTSGDMSMELEYTDLGSTAQHDVSDKAGPVITSAIYCPAGYSEENGFDTLVVYFSESMRDINSTKPFDLLAVEENKNYHLELEQMALTNKVALFEAKDIVNTIYPEDGDSIWIDYQENVADILENAQGVKDNKRVPLRVKERPFAFIVSVLIPINPKKYKLPSEITISDNIMISHGVIITLDPVASVPEEKLKQTTCSMSIFDAVGNTIATCNGYDDNSSILQMDVVNINGRFKIVIVWSGKNQLNRFVGEGAYRGVIKVTYPSSNRDSFYVMIGVKK